MKVARAGALGFLALICLSSLAAGWIAPTHFETQNRNAILVAPCRTYPLGTDDLGRDLLSRLLYGSRVTLLLAPASALVATGIALLVGSLAGVFGGMVRVGLHRIIDLFLSIPWLFLLLIVRAMLPLNLSPAYSVLTTFLVLGTLGWASSARVLSESVTSICATEYIMLSRLQGVTAVRRLTRHIFPNFWHLIVAQFWICVPVFIVSEANLGLLGLGIGEPLPSWGNLLHQLENYDRVVSHPWLLTPLFVVVLFLVSIQVSFTSFSKRLTS